MKTATAKATVVKVRVASESEAERFKLWYQHHGKREFEKWQKRNQYNKPPVDRSVIAISKQQTG